MILLYTCIPAKYNKIGIEKYFRFSFLGLIAMKFYYFLALSPHRHPSIKQRFSAYRSSCLNRELSSVQAKFKRKKLELKSDTVSISVLETASQDRYTSNDIYRNSKISERIGFH